MKVFEVITEHYEGKEIKTSVQYVTEANDSLQKVAEYFTEHCYQYEMSLKSVRELLVIVQHIPTESPELRYDD